MNPDQSLEGNLRSIYNTSSSILGPDRVSKLTKITESIKGRAATLVDLTDFISLTLLDLQQTLNYLKLANEDIQFQITKNGGVFIDFLNDIFST